MIRVVLPAHLRTLAGAGGELQLDVAGQATQRSILDALEVCYPMLRGTLRDQVTGQRRPFVRFFACEEDLSHQPPDAPLPAAVASGAEPFLIVGAIAGGSSPRQAKPPAPPHTHLPTAVRRGRRNRLPHQHSWPHRAVAALSATGANVNSPCGSTSTRSCWPSRTSPFKIIRPSGVSTFF